TIAWGLALVSGCQPVSIQKIRARPSMQATARLERIPEHAPLPLGGANGSDPDVWLARASARCRASLASERKSRDFAGLLALEAVADASEALAGSRSDP